MNILVTGSKGMAGSALVSSFKHISDSNNPSRSGIVVDNVFEYDIDSTKEELDYFCSKADFVFNFAGINRPKNPEEFRKHNSKATVMLSSSIQATLSGRFGDSEYGRSKRAGEDLMFEYGKETGSKVAVYRFPNIMGHSRPKYNSAVSTFCWAVANNEPYIVNDRSTELELLYINDLVDGMFALLEGKEQHCEFNGVETVVKEDGKFCCVPVTHKVTLGEIVDLLEAFKNQSFFEFEDNLFARKLYEIYLSYLPDRALHN